ncbi:MAG: TIGR02530 family flagellar biosynthesis protein [Solirubrobacteraceae bacterium]
MSPISNPALIPPGGLGTPPAGGTGRTGATKPAGGATPKTPPGTAPGSSFADALAEASAGGQPLQFSRHALARVQRRGIELDSATLGRLSEGVGRAASKGSRDSLVLVDDTAFVVSVSNRTVITAVGSEHMKDNVFTNIDSAVIA